MHCSQYCTRFTRGAPGWLTRHLSAIRIGEIAAAAIGSALDMGATPVVGELDRERDQQSWDLLREWILGPGHERESGVGCGDQMGCIRLRGRHAGRGEMAMMTPRYFRVARTITDIAGEVHVPQAGKHTLRPSRAGWICPKRSDAAGELRRRGNFVSSSTIHFV
jgi:hypothetical protein